jgi:hypothetical protein
MKKSIFKGKSTRTKIFSVITIVGIVLLLGLNLGLTYLGGQRLFMADLTLEGIYTLSDKMLEVCHTMLDPDENGNAKTIKITFCTDPDYLIASDKMRATYFMALALRNKFDNVVVETVNVALDPTAVSMYKTTSRDNITSADVIFSYGAKYKIVDATAFWTSDNFSYNGEYRVASIIASLLAIERPVAYFVTDNGASYYDPANPDSEMSISLGTFADLLNERGLDIKTLSLASVDAIPDDCALLIINNPTSDFVYDETRLDEFGYISDIEKIDRYLMRESAAVMFNKAYDVTLPNFENYCKEWGVCFGNSQVYDGDNALFTTIGGESDESTFSGVYDTNEQNFGYAYYGGYSTLSSAPKMVFANTGYLYCSMDLSDTMIDPGNKFGSRNYAPFIGTSANAYHLVGSAKDVGEKTLIAAGVRKNLDSYTSENSIAYLFCSNSADFFSNELLGNTSYANYDVLASVISNISRTDRYATIELGGLSLNSPSFGGKQLASTTLSDTPSKVYSWDAKEIIKYNKGLSTTAITLYTIVVMSVPTAALALGVIVFIKRKYL